MTILPFMRKLTVGRLAVQDCLAEIQSSATLPPGFDDVALWRHVRHLTAQLEVEREESLEDYFSYFVRELDAFVRRNPTHAPSANFAQQVRARIDLYLDSQDSDPLNLDFVFRDVHRVVAELCSNLNIAPPGGVDFTVIPVWENRVGASKYYFVTGGTEVKRTREELTGDIFLVLQARDFDRDSYLATPYVLFHELLCHQVTSLRGAEEKDLFAEGWLDHVAHQVHISSMQGNGVAPESALPFRLAHMQEGEFAHKERIRSSDWRQLGKEMAAQLLSLLSEFVGEPREAETLGWRLSLMLSLATLADDERRDLILALRSGLKALIANQMYGKTSIQQDRLEEARDYGRACLQAYVDGGQDIQAFIDRVLRPA